MRIQFDDVEVPVYVFDSGEGEETERWGVGEYLCTRCDHHYVAVWRSSKPSPRCPQCFPNERTWRILEPEPAAAN